MKLIRMIARSFRDAFKSVFRNFSLSIASITCITITLIVVAASMVVSYNVDNFTRRIKKDVTIVVFVNREAKEEDIEKIKRKLQSEDNVLSVTYESKSQVLEQMKQTNDTLANVLKNWGQEDNPLQDSFLVKVKDIEKIKTTASNIKGYKNVEVVKYGEDMIDKLIIVFKFLEKISYGMVVALIIVTAFLISNTIKLTIFSRKREIEIMRLVGGSNFSINMPFVIEGCILGIIGAITPIIITIYGYNVLYEFFDGKLFSKFITLVNPYPFVFIVSGLLLLVGIVVGTIGSSSSVRKHLKI